MKTLGALIAMPISDEQLALNQALHNSNPRYGSRSQASGIAAYLPLALFRMHGVGLCSSVLDYGTGKGLLVDRLRAELPATIQIDGFDPAVKKWSHKPVTASDFLFAWMCLSMLKLSIDVALEDIRLLTRHFCFVAVDLRPAVKRYPTVGMLTFGVSRMVGLSVQPTLFVSC